MPLMKAFYLHSNKDIRAAEVDLPSIGAGEVLVAVERIGICGSDIEYYHHFKCGAFVPHSPFILGHEFAGKVAKLGPDATVSGNGQTLKEGTPVAVDPSLPCGRCEFCHSGRYNLCSNMKFLGSAAADPHIDGAMREYIAMPARNCYVLPEGVSLAEGALLEPLSIALHAASRAGSVAGLTALVSGAGTIGRLMAMVLHAFGSPFVGVSDPIEDRRDAALKGGANVAFDPAAADYSEQVRRACSGGFDLIFEASGVAPAVRSAIHAARRGGTIVQIGTISREIELPANLIMVKELDYRGSFRTAHEYGVGLELVAAKRIDVMSLLTHEFGFDDVERAFAATREPGSMKVHLNPGS